MTDIPLEQMPSLVLKMQLSAGYVVSYDSQDYGFVSSFKWHRRNINGRMYVGAYIEGKRGLMHRMILGCADDEEVDHIDGNPLNNCRSNLRICSRAQNQRNRSKFKNNKSGYKGVYLDKRRKSYKRPWIAQIVVDGRKKNIGAFETALDAAKAYDGKAKELFGEFARLNFQSEKYQYKGADGAFFYG